MASGVPVIGTDVAGIRDVIVDGENGLLVNFASSADMSNTITRVIEDRALRSRLIDNGLRVVRERFSWEIVIPQYRRLLGIHSLSPVLRGEG